MNSECHQINIRIRRRKSLFLLLLSMKQSTKFFLFIQAKHFLHIKGFSIGSEQVPLFLFLSSFLRQRRRHVLTDDHCHFLRFDTTMFFPLSRTDDQTLHLKTTVDSNAFKRFVHYDIEPIHDENDHHLIKPLKEFDNILRRRHIAHWGLPEWLGDNHFLLQKHRPPANSVRECLLSIGSIHSETVNIWTHLIGALCVMLTYLLFLVENLSQMDLSDLISFSFFFLSAILCLTFSTLLHIFINYSPGVLIIVSKLDYLGINLLILGSMIPVINYLFYCYFQLKAIYISILVVLSFASMIGTSSATCSKPKCRPFKAILFITLGLYGVVPAIHACLLHGFIRLFEMGFIYLCIMAVTYILGGIAYAVRVPERFFPGRFDIVGHSHQILHIAVIAAIYLHFYGICCLFENVIQTEQCLIPAYVQFNRTFAEIH